MTVRPVLACAAALALTFVRPASAQNATTGALQGAVGDADGGAPLAGVTVVVTGPALEGMQVAISDAGGAYKITQLPPGLYLVSFTFGAVTAKARDVRISIGQTTPLSIRLDLSNAGAVFEFDGDRLILDPSDAKRVTTVDRSMLTKGVIPGDGFEGALGIAPGSAGDGLGPGFSGSGYLENRTAIDGLDTTGITYGGSGTPLVNDFIEEITVITGGYNAEYGRATGGVVQVVTRSGSNHLHGDLFTRVTPGFLTAASAATPSEASSIDARRDLGWQADMGFDLGGPIVRDRLWFFVGLAPQLTRDRIVRTTKRLTDCRTVDADGTMSQCRPELADGRADRDPVTGYRIWEDVDRTELAASTTRWPLIAKLSGALSPEHQGQLSLIATPSTTTAPGVRGAPAATSREQRQLTSDLAFKWSSKFDDGKTELQSVLGWHRSALRSRSIDPGADDLARSNLYYGDLGTWSGLGYESDRTRAGCSDGGAGDPYPFITNCPDEGEGYAVGGPGPLTDELEQRYSARLIGTQRLRAGGSHELMGGVDLEDTRLDHLRGLSGGAYYDVFGGSVGEIDVLRWVRLAPAGDPGSEFSEMCKDTDAGTTHGCRYLDRDDVLGRTLSSAAFVRDSWQPVPNLTFNVGLRYEEQRLRYARALQHTVDPFTGERLGKNAMVLDGMWAPRAGVVWDWTGEGRAKAFGHWGRFYEAIPMDINNRSFGGETLYQQRFDLADQCGSADPRDWPGGAPPCQGTPASGETVFGSGVLVAPGVRAQYLDEQIAGVEVEVADDTTVGLAWQRRSLGRILEDVSVDNAQTYILANPGEWSSDAQADLEARIAAESDPDRAAALQAQLDQFRKIRGFDRPRRDYDALQLTATRRQGKNLYLQASYTYSRLRGNYPGLYSADNGQIDPNISSQFDLIELMSNREGPLPMDRPHYLKLDGYYTRELGANAVTGGLRVRALSGTPQSALARHHRYGPDESFLLPRGAMGRGDFDWGVDLHLGLARRLGGDTSIEIYADLFNLFDRQGVVDRVQRFTDDPANPIVGGDYQDLVFAKRQNSRGGETNEPISRYLGFGSPLSRYAPLSARLGARLTF